MLITYVITLLCLSLVTVLVFAADKINAASSRAADGSYTCVFRVPEITLITLAAMGGALGALLSAIFLRRQPRMRHRGFFALSLLFSAAVQLVLIPFCLIVH